MSLSRKNKKYLRKSKRNFYYYLRKNILTLGNFINKNKKHKYVFILSPPYSGSTLLNQIISTSNNVSCNNNIGTREGQTLPEVSDILFKNKRWDKKKDIPWKIIKKTWRKYWDLSKPILLDKSTTNIMRANKIREIFKPASFICLVRNPYAQCEGIIRRSKKSAESAAKFTIKCLKYQKRNIENEKNLLFFTYEELCNKKEKIINDIHNFIPEINDIDINKKFKAHNFKSEKYMHITNLNQEKINLLKARDLKIINKYFKQEREILDYFNYTIIEEK